ncbi:type II toxin-antitoxin system ParD family antitoxin [Sphingobacterium deserti]|uniref:Addiction module antidote protein, cc2985 family n=1 Tax=Sphingobacterium deserti TaxID=1229276 RepID=A0A0B8SYZ8_9SPHI|nr:type II toxin-antitoxin system ParD family antitoxin [Sphingobacterium deserti]KGE12747.1 addiction module antidote protein, cc2985 family [Sphingobacterium deserti]
MGRNTSVSLGDYFEDFVTRHVADGRYKNASEVIRAGLRLLEVEEDKVKALKSAIEEGVNSGIATEFDAKKHLINLKSAKKQDG